MILISRRNIRKRRNIRIKREVYRSIRNNDKILLSSLYKRRYKLMILFKDIQYGTRCNIVISKF
uniref:Uncharacterized protein n=1 Tax=Rhizophagus irregularis (strain DAOM 181602 / DAOM 197198 / MUCL 43194) TaxID=747089 RepID=U9U319_RHIID